MRTFIEWLTGQNLPAGAVEATWSLRGIPAGWALLIFLAGTAAILWSYNKFTPDIPAHRRKLLASLRTASFALIIVFLLQPVLNLRIEEPVRSALLVLFDNSRSMQIVDERASAADRSNATSLSGKEQPSRADLVRSLGTNPQLDLFPRLAGSADIKFAAFGKQLRSLSETSGGDAAAASNSAIQSLAFDDDVTALGDAVVGALDEWRGSPLAGILLVTDGAGNAGRDPVAAARIALRNHVPLFIYGTGIPTAKDLRVVSADAPSVGFLKETSEVRSVLRIQGYPTATPVKVSLTVDGKVAETKTVSANPGTTDVTFDFVPETAGTHELVVSADPLENETQKENNSAKTSIRVVDQKVKLLYVEQRPRWDFRYIVNTLKDDRRVELKCHVVLGERSMTGEDASCFLDTLPDAAALMEYQVVILGDVDPESLGTERMEILSKLVSETGGGMIFLAGPAFDPAAYAKTPLQALLPVDLVPVSDPADSAKRFDEPRKLELTPVGAASPLLTLAENPAQNQKIWNEFSGVRWFSPAVKIKPTAETLVVAPPETPVVATQSYGRGQTLYFGTDETYRWRSKVGAKHFIRIWTQIIQTFALERLQGASDKIQLRASRPVFYTGDTVEISGRVFDENFKPLTDPRLEGEFLLEGNPSATESFNLELSPETPGLYSGQWIPKKTGTFTFIPLRDRSAATRFEVKSRDAEMLNPSMEREILETMARETSGKFLTESTLHELPDLIKTHTATIPRKKSIDVYALWPLLLLALLLMFTEWTLRRLARLK